MAVAYVYFTALPTPLQNTIPNLPYILAVAVLLMAIYFNIGSLFYLGLICFFSWFVLSQGWLVSATTVNLTAVACILSLLALGLLTEKGLLSAAWLRHLIVIVIFTSLYVFATQPPLILDTLMATQVLPISWFDWTPLNQLTWGLSLLVGLILATTYMTQNKRQSLNGLIILIVILLLLSFRENDTASALICNGGLLVLLFSALQKSWHLAYVDALTALPGRRALEEKLQRSLGIYALAMLDVDHFKKFNDSYGHDVGDDVLRMIAAKINQVGGGGKAFRYGGEEFTVVFNNHSADEISTHLQTLIDVIAATPFVVNRRKKQKPKTVQVTISIGLTDSIQKANASETIKTADEALYQAKKKGRNRLHIKH